MKIVDIERLEKTAEASQKALSEIALRIHQMQEALNEFANTIKTESQKPPF